MTDSDDDLIKCTWSVGCPPPSSSLNLFGGMWKSFQFHIHDFATLSSELGNYLQLPLFKYNGHNWRVEVFPGGQSDISEGCVSAYIHHHSEDSIVMSYAIHIINKNGECCEGESDNAIFSSEGDNWGWHKIISRSDVLDESKNILDSEGSLAIIVSMKEEVSRNEFVPQNPLLNMIQQMFNDEATADVCFEVVVCSNKKNGGEQKKSKSSVSFHAHRLILKKCAPMLADLLGDKDTAIITDMKPEIFGYLLCYVYGGEIPDEELKTHSRDIIDAADKYAIVNLKLAAEVAYVENIDISCDNAVDNTLYADGKNCALIKEKVVDFLARNHFEAAEKISFTDCPGHVINDILVAIGRRDKYEYNVRSAANVDKMRTLSISALRWILHKKGLEVDGSREAMIDAIKNNDKKEH